MSDRDALVSDVTVVLDAAWGEEPRTTEALDKLRAAGLEIRDVDTDNSVVEGSVNYDKIRDLQNLDCVDYVRVVFTYVADYPAGDPRDVRA